MPKEFNTLPFSRLHDINLNMTQAQVERGHRLQREGAIWRENVDGYPVAYVFVDGKLQSMASTDYDLSEPLSQDRFRHYVLETFRQLGVTPVCGIDLRDGTMAARFDMRDATFLVVHVPETVGAAGQEYKQASVMRWWALGIGQYWSRFQSQRCVR